MNLPLWNWHNAMQKPQPRDSDISYGMLKAKDAIETSPNWVRKITFLFLEIRLVKIFAFGLSKESIPQGI